MKLNICNNIVLYIFTIFIITPEYIQSARRQRSCPISDIQLFGHKAFCESGTASSISCTSNSHHVKKVYLSCDVGYYNEEGITQQILYCTEKGRWSEIPIKCEPECITAPQTIELIKLEELKFPTAYVEVVRITPLEGKPNVFPGILISERNVLTKAQYFDDYDSRDFKVRNYKSPKIFIDNEIYLATQRNYDGKSQDDDLSIIFLPFGKYIIYDKYTKPVCRNITNIPEFKKFKTLQFSFDDRYVVRQNSRVCMVPHVDNTKIDMTCYDIHSVNKLLDCSNVNSAEKVQTRCQIGYINRKGIELFDNYLTYCHLNRWLVFGEENDCESICGIVNEANQMPFNPVTFDETNTDIVSAPWHAGIYVKDTKKSKIKFEQICGSSIIHTNIVISAAHCFYDSSLMSDGIQNSSNYLVGAGKRYRSRDIIEKFQQYARIDKIHIPPHYKPHSVENDIAMLVLDHHLTLTSHVKPICIDWELYKNYNIDENIMGQIFGWGVNPLNGIPRSELRGITLKILPNNQCKIRVGSNFDSEITGDRLCAANDFNVTACQGDSGGGFVVREQIGKSTRYVLKGIVSIGIDRKQHCSGKAVTILTNVQYYQNIVKRIISSTRDDNVDKYLEV